MTPSSDENKRTSAEFSITLSSHLITAALAILTIEGAYVAFAMGERVIGPEFWLASAASALAFVASIFAAGKAITKVRNEGFTGNWTLETGRNLFEAQAFLCIVGLFAFALVIVFSGEPSDSRLEERVVSLEVEVAELRQQADTLNSTTTQLQVVIDQLITTLTDLEGSFRTEVTNELNRVIETIESNAVDAQAKVDRLNSRIDELESIVDTLRSDDATMPFVEVTPGG